MSAHIPLFEHVPLPSYLFRRVAEDFVLEGLNAAGREFHPGIATFIGRPMKYLYRDQPQVVANANRCMREQATVVSDLLFRRYDQTEATQSVRLTYVFLPPDHMVVFMERLASQESSDAALRESEARYCSLVASVPDGLLVRGSDGRVLACNDVFVRMMGQSSQADLIGGYSALALGFIAESEGQGVVVPEDYPSMRVLRSGQPEYARPFVMRRPDGTRRHLSISSQPIRGADERITGSVTTFTDVTEQRELEEELRRAHRLESIGRLAGGIAHDFNNLLAAMLGSLELLEDVCPPSGHADLATVRHAATRARDLTRQLLAFARKQPVEFKVIELSALVTSVERMLRRLVGPNIELCIQNERRVAVRADAALLEQVLVNLVVNASEAMPEGGRLNVRVGVASAEDAGAPSSTRESATALLEVSDSGVGMNQETQLRVFDPFFTTKTHGTGLGLASSYGIIKQHGGDIIVDSALGSGACFRVLLPSVESESQHSQPAETERSAPQNGWVLLVDDEELVRNTTGRLLESLGYSVLSAGSAIEALKVSREYAGKLDVLLCDVVMPGRNGPSIAAELMRERPTLKVLFASGYAPEVRDDLPRGALYLQKPFRRVELLAKLRELMT